MDCDLTNTERINGTFCRSWNCQPCAKFKTKEESDLIKKELEQVKAENEKLKLDQKEWNLVHGRIVVGINEEKKQVSKNLTKELEQVKADLNEAQEIAKSYQRSFDMEKRLFEITVKELKEENTRLHEYNRAMELTISGLK